jgi:hypothetical protein
LLARWDIGLANSAKDSWKMSITANGPQGTLLLEEYLGRVAERLTAIRESNQDPNVSDSARLDRCADQLGALAFDLGGGRESYGDDTPLEAFLGTVLEIREQLQDPGPYRGRRMSASYDLLKLAESVQATAAELTKIRAVLSGPTVPSRDYLTEAQRETFAAWLAPIAAEAVTDVDVDDGEPFLPEPIVGPIETEVVGNGNAPRSRHERRRERRSS